MGQKNSAFRFACASLSWRPLTRPSRIGMLDTSVSCPPPRMSLAGVWFGLVVLAFYERNVAHAGGVCATAGYLVPRANKPPSRLRGKRTRPVSGYGLDSKGTLCPFGVRLGFLRFFRSSGARSSFSWATGDTWVATARAPYAASQMHGRAAANGRDSRSHRRAVREVNDQPRPLALGAIQAPGLSTAPFL